MSHNNDQGMHSPLPHDNQGADSDGALPTSDTDTIHRAGELKLFEARSAVILLRHSRLSTNNEYTQWVLKHLFQPLTKRGNDAMNILHISKHRKCIWKIDHLTLQDNTSTIGTDSSPANPDTSPAATDNGVYVLTPRTNIMTIAYEYRVAFIIDMSSSLATVGCTAPDILLSHVFATLRNSLEGIVQPFHLVLSANERVMLRPKIYLTVMADCSQFASNINVIPLMAEYPTIRVFVQNVFITADNIQSVIGLLNNEFMTFQKDMTEFRKFIKNERSNFGYDLDVSSGIMGRGGDVLDATSSPTPQLATHSLSEPHPPPATANHSSTIASAGSKEKDTSYHSSKREVWGVGKSGANLSRILHAGHFALKLLPRKGRPQLILITDGAMKSNVVDNTFVRQFADEDTACHIIQIGSAASFIPGRNFGFIPDNEVLRFLARATCGTFTYSDECKRINTADITSTNRPSTPLHHSVVTHITDKNGKTDKTTTHPPNMYHRKFLFRELLLSKQTDPRLQQRDIKTPSDAQHDSTGQGSMDVNGDKQDRFNFPWDPCAKPPQDATRLLKYREYGIPAEFSHIVASRAREGFSLQSVTFDDGTGVKKADKGLESLEVPSLAAIKKERIQIVMVLHWQPNVVIEYRIRATWLPIVIGKSDPSKNEAFLLPSNVFSRAKAPRAEIFVRTDAEFAHMLQNWDVFRRRAQMMGVVTGNNFDTYTAPVYVKAERLKNFLVDIYEGDEMLRTVIGFNSKYLQSLGPPSLPASQPQSDGAGRQKNAFTDAFHAFWERINLAETRQRTRSWYDYDCIDFLVGDVSPYMAPKLVSTFNKDFVANVEAEMTLSIKKTESVLKPWIDFEGRDGTLVKLMNKRLAGAVTKEDTAADPLSCALGYPPSFLEIRIRHEYGRLVALRLLFFNMDVVARNRAIEYLKHTLETSLASTQYKVVCQRPFSRLLMRDPQHFTETEVVASPMRTGDLTDINSKTRGWCLPVSMFLTSEYIVRDYLRHMSWTWQTDNYQDQYHRDNKMMPIHDLAFQFLCQVRLDQGYQLVSPRPDSTHFYQEIHLPGAHSKQATCAIQYFIWKDTETGKIKTELWMEPSCSQEQYNLVKAWTVEPDRRTISQLVTFDQIQAVGVSKGKGDFKKASSHSRQPDLDDTVVMMLPELFDVTSVLGANPFVIASFASPRCHLSKSSPLVLETQPAPPTLSADIPEEELHVMSENDIRSLRAPAGHGRYKRRQEALRISAPLLFENTDLDLKDMCLHPDAILTRNKEAMAMLDIHLQNYAILHYYTERAMTSIMDGEIVMTHHDHGTAFWRQLQDALLVATNQAHFSSSCLASDLTKMRCFVKVFDKRSFVVVLFPSLEAVTRSLVQRQEAGITEEPASFVDCFMFECVRQKPLTPMQGRINAQSIRFTDEGLKDSEVQSKSSTECPKVTLSKLDYLVHQPDGLGESLRPELYQGHFVTRPKMPILTERVLRVAQDVTRAYNRCFFKSLYACLLRGFSVCDSDLAKMLDACDESTVTIDMDSFINVMTMMRHISGQSAACEAEIQAKFASIFRYYFEPVRTEDGRRTNLYYYKPPFIKSAEMWTNASSLPSDERISQLVDLVAYSQIPLLIRLECVFESKAQRTVTVPISSLPVSFSGKTDLEEFSFEPQIDDPETWSPLDSGETDVSLQLVCLSMPQSQDEYANATTFDKESTKSNASSHSLCYTALSRHRQHALAETEARIRWLLIEETFHGLLSAPKITRGILEHVVQQLDLGSTLIKVPTSVTIPLLFVKGYSKSMPIFMDELEKDGDVLGRYQLGRLDNYFYVCQDFMYNPRQGGTVSEGTSPTTPSQPTNESPHLPDLHCDDHELCRGLGISTCPAVPEAQLATQSNTAVPLPHRPLYWMILVPQRRHIRIYFHCKHQHFDREDILESIQWKLKEIEERTNRLMLLASLQETHFCSRYLETCPEESESSSNDEESEKDPVVGSCQSQDEVFNQGIVFQPGQFACPVVFTKRFPLHSRLQPNVALKYLTADVLRVFLVQNRRNMFVIEHDNVVVYCKIFEQEAEKDDVNVPESVCSSVNPTKSAVHHLIEQGDGRLQASEELSTPTSKATPGGASTISTDTTRELVLEVHGLCLPPWVQHEFVDMIENRLVSHITLNEIQGFFLRNPNTKPTAEDLRFILPIEKKPNCREILKIPVLVKDPTMHMQLFKQSILADSIRPLQGKTVAATVKAYEERAFEDAFQAQSPKQRNNYDEYCFYYNCTQRFPGSSTALQLAVGQGIAGICVTLLDAQGKPVNHAPYDKSADIDPQRIASCLEDDFKVESIGDHDDADYYVWIDLWVMGAADEHTLMHHLYDRFRQSLCDYFIEKTVSMDLSMALSEVKRTMSGNIHRRVGKVLRSKFIESVLYILQKAAEWRSPSVSCFDQTLALMPWCMDNVLEYLDNELCALDPSLKMAIASSINTNQFSAAPKPCPGWDLYCGLPSSRQKLQSNIRLVGISGLQEFVERLGSLSNPSTRRTSLKSDRSSLMDHSRRSSGASSAYGSKHSVRDGIYDRSRSSSTSRSASVAPSKSRGPPIADTSKSCFLIVTMDAHHLAAYTYNWADKASVTVLENLFCVAMRQETRNEILTNILHQKMGLFNHSTPIKQSLDRCSSLSALPSLQQMMTVANPDQTQTPSLHLPSPKVQAKPKSLDHVNRADNSPRQSRRNTGTSISLTGTLTELRELVTNPATVPTERSKGESNPTMSPDPEKDKGGATSASPNVVIKPYVMYSELDQALVDCATFPMPGLMRDRDFLQKHGLPFMDAVMRRSKILGVHRKALTAYTKWRQRYSHVETPTGPAEKLTRQEVAAILRSSRLLHYCRTPLLFSMLDQDVPLGDVAAKETAEAWYKRLLDRVVSEYCTYLEGVDMHLIDFANPDKTEEQHLKMSQFQAAKNLTINTLPVYLLCVFEGGSIICELRMTGVFVSVTLYTLHRKYGSLDYNRFRRESREVKREKFKAFEQTCGDFKQFIHVNSFVYDFHLRALQSILECKTDTVPSAVNLMAVIKLFATVHKEPASYGRNRLIHGFYEFESDIDDDTFFRDLYASAARQGLGNLTANGAPVGVVVTGSDLKVASQAGSNGVHWKHTLVFCPADNVAFVDGAPAPERSRLMLEYFVLCVCQDDIKPSEMVKQAWTPAVKKVRKSNAVISDPIDTLLHAQEGYTLHEVAVHARQRLDRIVAETSIHCKRIKDWSSIYTAESPELSTLRFTRLLGDFDRIDLVDVDKNIARLLALPLHWDNVFDSLRSIQSSTVKDFTEDGVRHLLIYNARYMDYMIHLQKGDKVRGWIISREMRANKTQMQGAEREQIVSLGSTLCYLTWMETVGRQGPKSNASSHVS